MSADHAPKPRRARQSEHQRRAHASVRVRLRIGDDVERIGQEPVARENRRRLVERLMCRRPAAPQIVIVHRRQVVMRERIAMNHFKRAGGAQRRFADDAKESRQFDDQNGRSRLPPPSEE